MKLPRKSADQTTARGYLDGQMLIAMPAMSDERFARAVIYVCAHSSEGAMGIVVNQPAGNIKFPDLLVQLEVIPAAERIELPGDAEVGQSAQGRAGGNRARLRAAFGRFLHREFDAADRRRHLPDRHARHPQGDRARRWAGERHSRARLCRLGARAIGKRNPAERLAALRRRSGIDFRHRYRRQIPEGAAQDRHRPGHVVERSRDTPK